MKESVGDLVTMLGMSVADTSGREETRHVPVPAPVQAVTRKRNEAPADMIIPMDDEHFDEF